MSRWIPEISLMGARWSSPHGSTFSVFTFASEVESVLINNEGLFCLRAVGLVSGGCWSLETLQRLPPDGRPGSDVRGRGVETVWAELYVHRLLVTRENTPRGSWGRCRFEADRNRLWSCSVSAVLHVCLGSEVTFDQAHFCEFSNHHSEIDIFKCLLHPTIWHKCTMCLGSLQLYYFTIISV